METRRRFADLLVSSARRLVLPLMAKNRMLSARLAWSRLSVHIVQVGVATNHYECGTRCACRSLEGDC